MDLFDLTPTSDELVVKLKHPTKNKDSEHFGVELTNKDGSPMTITLHSATSKQAKKVMHDIADKKLAKAKGSIENLTTKDWDDFNIETLARNTKDWNITWKGEQPKFSVETAKDIYEKAFWLREQVEAAESENLNFMKG